MAIHFYKLRVKDIIRQTKDAVSVVFDVPEDLKETFRYKHGQNLTIRFFIDGIDQRRSYSISSSALLNEDLTVTVKAVEGGLVSNYINKDLKICDEIDVMPPLGNFTIDLNSNNQKTYFLIGAGSGITPLMSIIKSILEVEEKSRVILIYANRNTDSIIFYKDLNFVKNKFFDNFRIHHILSRPSDNWEGDYGRLDQEKILNLLDIYIPNDKFNAEYFLCGPSGLISEAQKALEKINITPNKVHKETFIVDKDEQTEQIQFVPHNTGAVDNIKVVLYGEEHIVPMDKEQTILVAGIRAGIDPPFSCQIGACSTCRAKVTCGEVKMEVDDALTEYDIQEGYVLTCTSYPLTNDVTVNYDE